MCEHASTREEVVRQWQANNARARACFSSTSTFVKRKIDCLQCIFLQLTSLWNDVLCQLYFHLKIKICSGNRDEYLC